MISKADILFQDNYLIAVHKPSGLMVEPDAHGNPNAVEQVLKLLPHPPKIKGGLGVVHRLDRPVSGVLIFAIRPAALKELQEQIRSRKVRKNYIAEVEGIIQEDSGSWAWPLGRTKDKKLATEDRSKKGQQALTKWKVVERRRSSTLLSISLHSGRFHQIRAHASLAGHPILGDGRYGAKVLKDHSIHLASSEYSFKHPISDEQITIRSRTPDFLGSAT